MFGAFQRTHCRSIVKHVQLSLSTSKKMNSKCLILIFLLVSFVLAEDGPSDSSKRHAVAKRKIPSLFDFPTSITDILDKFFILLALIIKKVIKFSLNSSVSALPLLIG
ncbi:hypothetical protein JTE90_023573 [Oedothorax gibbosus]|uniref:Uncharacterized protein n=1 Tax=Oedothorax gibbosus TaxID=931172 RepID=A0AAV6UAR2_9ARAC|nr:hypothetical protein JTE90_023573 [Oedothorax gibbosus]